MSNLVLPNIKSIKTDHDFIGVAQNLCQFSFNKATPKDLDKFQNFIFDFNKAWTEQRIKSKTIAFQDQEIIAFSSVHKLFSWLSNFFSTLIFDREARRCYPTLEHAYVAYKVNRATEGNFQPKKEFFALSAKEVKQFGHEYSFHDEETLGEMARLVQLKFSQNPLLQQGLVKTTGELEEFTSDSYWGTCLGTEKGPDSNHLGKIIMAYRNAQRGI